MSGKSSLLFLLFQARAADDPVRMEEKEAFVQRLGVHPDQVTLYDLLAEPPSWRGVRRYDAFLVGGSGEYNISDGSLPHLKETLAFFGEVVDRRRPMFGSCFGFQLLVAALGGTVVRDEARAEIGTCTVCLTEAGRRDELFGRLPTCFGAPEGHKERADRWPESALLLAESEMAPQALRIPKAPIWATQFHPELSAEENRRRYLRYGALYRHLLGEEEFQRTLNRFQPTPEVEGLLADFVEVVFGG